MVLLEPDQRDLPEPVVLYAEDEQSEPVADVDLQAEDELVWTSESDSRPE